METVSANGTGKHKHINVGLLAHVDAGKTTLSEGLLYAAGRVREPGRVDNGDAFLDNYALERERGITIFSKQAELVWHNVGITLLDTPGHVDFSAEMERTLGVLDYGILVISGADGVQGHTRTLWQLLEKYRVPVFLFINKMDQPGVEKEAALADIEEQLSGSFVDFTEREGTAFEESLALCDDELLETFLETGRVDRAHIPALIRERKVFPCFFGSALRQEGVEELLQGLAEFSLEPEYGSELGLRVYKIGRDSRGNRLTYVKVTGGCLLPRTELSDSGGKWREKVNQIRLYSGEKYETAAAPAGTICALTGLTETRPGQGLGAETDGDGPVLEPVLNYRIQLPEGCDAAEMLPRLRLLEEEDPELHIIWNEKSQEIQIRVMGEVQLEVLQRLIQERFGTEVLFSDGSIVYRETIRRRVEGIGHFEPLRHYAEVHLLMEPGEPGSGFVAAADCSEDILDRNWQRLVLTHLLERQHPGVLSGSALTDVRVTLIAGKAHPKHTEGGDFRQAVYRALRQGMMQADPVLLEPWYEFRIEVPEEMVGRAMTDIERMSGTFELKAGSQGMSVLTGQAPVAAMQNYPKEVAAYTRGLGRVANTVKGYFPCHNQEEVLQQLQYDPERDTDNPTGSVFCAHGSGFSVDWQHVREYMHVDSGWRPDGNGEREEAAEERPAPDGKEEREWIDVEEVDHILERTSHANRRDKSRPHKGISGKRIRSRRAEEADSRKGAPAARAKSGRPRTRYLLVDGYNIIFAWEELRELAGEDIEAARGRLMDILCNYQGFTRYQLILVFDAYRVQNHRAEIFNYHNIHVVYTREAETADQYIEKFAHENARAYDVTVATSDGLEQIIIRGEGCHLFSARDFQEEIRRAEGQMREYMDDSS